MSRPRPSTHRPKQGFKLPPPPTPRNPKTLYWILGGTAYALSSYTAYLYFSIRKLPSHPHDPAKQEDLSYLYDDIAGEYDRKIGWSEMLMGMGVLRWWLVGKARGEVLEAAAGTGRNMGFYRLRGEEGLGRVLGGGEVTGVTFVDRSPEMLREGRRVFREKYPHYKNARFIVQSSSRPVLSPTTDAKFDTILQTMGLCSVSDPVRELRTLSSMCKPDGKILLLEHGRSGYAWLDDLLDRLAGGRARSWGCWWNRDVEGLVREAGLEVVRVRRWHLGTTVWVEARPGRGGEVEEVEEVEE